MGTKIKKYFLIRNWNKELKLGQESKMFWNWHTNPKLEWKTEIVKTEIGTKLHFLSQQSEIEIKNWNWDKYPFFNPKS